MMIMLFEIRNNEMGTHITRMTQLQEKLDALREAVRQLAKQTSKSNGQAEPDRGTAVA